MIGLRSSSEEARSPSQLWGATRRRGGEQQQQQRLCSSEALSPKSATPPLFLQPIPSRSITATPVPPPPMLVFLPMPLDHSSDRQIQIFHYGTVSDRHAHPPNNLTEQPPSRNPIHYSQLLALSETFSPQGGGGRQPMCVRTYVSSLQ